MRTKTTRTRFAVALAAALVTLGVAGAVALASVSVYNNNFSTKGKVKELSGAGGKSCGAGFRKKDKSLRVTVKKAPKACLLQLPVRGDAPRPDHELQVEGSISEKTESRARKDAFLAAEVRVGDGSYELRVFPKDGSFELDREPNGRGFPVEEDSDAIKGIGERNKLLLQAVGERITASINGEQVARVNDSHADDVKGTKLKFGAGTDSSRRDKVIAAFHKARVSVPNP